MITWEDLPDSVQRAVAGQWGPLKAVESIATTGTRPTVVLRLRTYRGTRILKATRRGSIAAEGVVREQHARAAFPDLSAPKLRYTGTIDGWHLSLFHDVLGSHRADLRPGSADLHRVLRTLAHLNKLRVEDTSGLRPVAADLSAAVLSGQALIESGIPGLDRHERDLLAASADAFTLASVVGPGRTLLHGNLVSRHLLVTKNFVRVVDWSTAAYGQAWVDVVGLGWELLELGHAVADVEKLLSAGFSCWRVAPAKEVTGLIAMRTLASLHHGLHLPRPGQRVSVDLVDAGLAWLKHRS